MPEQKTWTPEQVKAELPNVLGKRGNQTYTLRVTGRMLPFACVYVCAKVEGNLVKPLMGPCFEVAWETLAHSLNTGRPIII